MIIFFTWIKIIIAALYWIWIYINYSLVTNADKKVLFRDKNVIRRDCYCDKVPDSGIAICVKSVRFLGDTKTISTFALKGVNPRSC